MIGRQDDSVQDFGSAAKTFVTPVLCIHNMSDKDPSVGGDDPQLVAD